MIDDTYTIALEDKNLWAADTRQQKLSALKKFDAVGLIIRLNDFKGRLGGFIIFKRQYPGPLDINRVWPIGPWVEIDYFWIRPDLRNTGFLRKMIRYAVNQKKEILAGAKYLFFERFKNGKEFIFDFTRLYRKSLNGTKRIINNTADKS